MRVVPLYVRFGDKTYRDFVDLGPHEFYEKLRATGPKIEFTAVLGAVVGTHAGPGAVGFFWLQD
jgi:fatty acid-binding protein DegV